MKCLPNRGLTRPASLLPRRVGPGTEPKQERSKYFTHLFLVISFDFQISAAYSAPSSTGFPYRTHVTPITDDRSPRHYLRPGPWNGAIPSLIFTSQRRILPHV